MQIRKATKEDLKLISRLVKEEFNSYYDENEFTKTLVYFEDEICGFITYSLIYDRAEIEYIYVFDKYRNKKIASRLFDEMIKDIGNISISLEVKVTNDPAIKFYKKNNFKIVATREKYYQDVDGYLMVKEV